MAEKITFLPQQPVLPVPGTGQTTNRLQSGQDDGQASAVSFQDVLQNRIVDQSGIRFSQHAQDRLRTRNIRFDAGQMERIADAVDRAAQKGARDSLLLVDDVAAVVSVKNRTVITVVDNQSLRNNVFTNIDSAVIA